MSAAQTSQPVELSQPLADRVPTGGPRHKSNVLSERSESKDQPSLCPFDGEFVGLQ
jgi:hypothetical protein